EQASQPFQTRPGPNPAPPAKKPASPPASLIALWLILNKPDRAQALVTPQEQGKPPDAAVAMGTAEAFVLQGNWPQAFDAIQHVPEPDQLTAWVAVAALVVDLPDSGKVNDCLEKAFAAAAAHPKPETVSPWLIFRLVRLGVRAGM